MWWLTFLTVIERRTSCSGILEPQARCHEVQKIEVPYAVAALQERIKGKEKAEVGITGARERPVFPLPPRSARQY